MGRQRPWGYFRCASIWARGQFSFRGHGLEAPGRQIPGVCCKVNRVLVICGLRRATGGWQDGESGRRRHLRPDGYRVGRRDHVRAARQVSRRLSIRSWQRHCFSPPILVSLFLAFSILKRIESAIGSYAALEELHTYHIRRCQEEMHQDTYRPTTSLLRTAYGIRTTDLPTPYYTLYCSQYIQLRKGNMTNGPANGSTGHCSVIVPARH